MSGNSLDLCLFNCLDFSNLDVWTSSGSFVPWMSGPRPDLLYLGCLDLVRIFCALAVWTLSGSFVPWMSGPCPDLRALDVWTCPDPCILVVGTFRT